MRSPHLEASEEIEKHLLFRSESEIEEISRKTPWGFHRRWQLTNKSLEDFLAAPPKFVPTRILHVLAGEGEEFIISALCPRDTPKLNVPLFASSSSS